MDPQNQPPIVPPPTPHRFLNRKVLLIILGLLIIGTVTNCYEIYLSILREERANAVEDYIKNIKWNTSTTTPWQTYRSEKYGFEFSYPQDWQVSQWVSPDMKETRVEINSSNNSKALEEYRKQNIGGDMGPVNEIVIDLYPFSQERVENLNDYIKDGQEDGILSNVKPLIFSGLNGYELSENGFSSYYTIILEKDEYLYKIWFGYRWKKEELSSTESQILSSFKFIK